VQLKANKEIFSRTTRDKIRAAYAKGKRTFLLKSRKYRLVPSKHKGYFMVKPANDDKVPFALLETEGHRKVLDKKTGEVIAQHHKDVKAGKKVRPNFEVRKKAKKVK
jgi:hypothetical protein